MVSFHICHDLYGPVVLQSFWPCTWSDYQTDAANDTQSQTQDEFNAGGDDGTRTPIPCQDALSIPGKRAVITLINCRIIAVFVLALSPIELRTVAVL